MLIGQMLQKQKRVRGELGDDEAEDEGEDEEDEEEEDEEEDEEEEGSELESAPANDMER